MLLSLVIYCNKYGNLDKRTFHLSTNFLVTKFRNNILHPSTFLPYFSKNHKAPIHSAFSSQNALYSYDFLLYLSKTRILSIYHCRSFSSDTLSAPFSLLPLYSLFYPPIGRIFPLNFGR